MADTDREHATQIVGEMTGGDGRRARELAGLVYDNLRRYAASVMAQQRGPRTLQPTALVHEAFMRMVDQSRVNWQGRTHFFAVGAEMIRRVLVDDARRRGAQKRGGDRDRVDFDDSTPEAGARRPVDLLALDDALRKLEGLDPRAARIVELRFFGGLREEDAAAMLGISLSTLKEDWRMARSWLREELTAAAGAGGGVADVDA